MPKLKESFFFMNPDTQKNFQAYCDQRAQVFPQAVEKKSNTFTDSLKEVILAIIRRKQPKDKITYKEIIRLIHYAEVVSATRSEEIAAGPALDSDTICRAIGSLMDDGLIASDMELYLTKKGSGS